MRLRVALLLQFVLLALACSGANAHASISPRTALTGDIDGDGKTDLLMLDYQPGTLAGQPDMAVSIAYGDGHGAYSAPVLQGQIDARGSLAVTVADIDGDGISDFAFVQGPVAPGGQSTVTVWFGSRERTLHRSHVSAWESSGGLDSRYTRLLTMSFRGRTGLIAVDAANRLGVVLQRDGAGQFAPHSTFSLPYDVASIAVTGLDGEGNQSLTLADGSGKITTLHGFSSGVMGASGSSSVAAVAKAQGLGAVTGTLAGVPEPAAFEGAYTVTVTLTPSAATGTVAFLVDGVAVGSAPLSNGVATLSIAAYTFGSAIGPLLPGSHTLTASYSGDASFAGASFSGTHTVSLAPSSVTLTPTTPLQVYYGQGIDGTFAVQVLDGSYQATGTYTVLDNGVAVPSCTNLPLTLNGVPVNCPYGDPDFVDAGPHALTVQYNGDAVNAASDSPAEPYVVLPDVTVATLTSSGSPSNFGQAVAFTATVTGNAATPTGVVTFLDGATAIGSAPLNAAGVAAFTTLALAIGTHSITAVYAATLDFRAATSNPLSQRVLGEPVVLATAIGLSSSLNPSPVGTSITLTATVITQGPFTRLVTGVVTFYDGTSALGTGTLNGLGQATYSTSSLKVGSHPIIATYAGVPGVAGTGIDNKGGTDGFAASVSNVLTQLVTTPLTALPLGFSLNVTPVPVTIPAGQTASLQVQVLGQGGFTQQVQLACTNLTRDLGCTFVTALLPAGGGTTTLYLLPQGPHTCTTPPLAYYSGLLPWTGLIGLGLLLRKRRIGVLVLLLAVGLGLSACGSGNCTDLGVYPGNYTFTVTATAVGGPVSGTSSQDIGLTVLLP